MSTRVQPVSDLSGADIPADDPYHGPTRFTWDGNEYEVDLCESEADDFRAAMFDYEQAVKAVESFVAVSRQIVPALPQSVTTNPSAAGVVTFTLPEGANTATIPAESPKAPRKPRAARKATAATKTARTPAKSKAKAFSPPAEDLVLPADAPAATNGHVKTNPADVRAWAVANGYNLTGRGRIPSAVTAAYVAAL